MTLNMEVKKDGLRQTQDGIWKLTLTVHPNDMPVELMQAPMGTNYGLAMVAVDHDNPTKPSSGTTKEFREAEKTEGDKLRVRAVTLTKDERFQKYVSYNSPGLPITNLNEDCAKYFIYKGCNIKSRAELVTNKEAQEKFRKLTQKFKDWKFEEQYADNLSRGE